MGQLGGFVDATFSGATVPVALQLQTHSTIVLIKPTGIASGSIIGGSGNGYPELGLNASNKPYLNKQGVSTPGTAATAVGAGVYATVGYTYDNTANALLFYLNGVIDATLAPSAVSFTYPAGNGLQIGQASANFNGDIVYLYRYNRVLAAAEVAELTAEPYAMFQTRPISRWWALGTPAIFYGSPDRRPQ